MNEEKLDQEKIAKFISNRRKEKKYTQEQLGEIMGVSAKSVSKWENGRSLPDIGLFPKLAKVLGVSIADLFAGEVIVETTDENLAFFNDSTEMIIKKSNKKLLKFATKVFLGVLSIFAIAFCLYIYYDNYYKYKFYILSSDDKDFSIDGYLIQNIDNTMLSINSITFYDTSIGTVDEKKVSSVEIEITSNSKSISSSIIDVQKETYLSELLDKVNMNIYIEKNEEENRKIDINDLYMTIRYIYNGKIGVINIKIVDNVS